MEDTGRWRTGQAQAPKAVLLVSAKVGKSGAAGLGVVAACVSVCVCVRSVSF